MQIIKTTQQTARVCNRPLFDPGQFCINNSLKFAIIYHFPCYMQVYPTQTIYIFQQDGIKLSLRVSTVTYILLCTASLLWCAVHNTIFSWWSIPGPISDNIYNIRGVVNRRYWAQSWNILWQHRRGLVVVCVMCTDEYVVICSHSWPISSYQHCLLIVNRNHTSLYCRALMKYGYFPNVIMMAVYTAIGTRNLG